MAATTNFEIGDVNTAGNDTDVTMAYLQDEVKLNLILGLMKKSKSLHLILCALVFLLVFITKRYSLWTIHKTLAVAS